MYGGLGHGRESVKMEPRKRRGTEWCKKCHTYMEVHLTYHRCPVCGREQRKPGRTYKDRTAQSAEPRRDLMRQLQASLQAGREVSSATGTREFMHLELRGWLAIERGLLWCWLAICLVLYHLPVIISLDPDPLQYSWGGPGLFLYLPLFLILATLGGVLHTDPQLRRSVMLACLVCTFVCLATALFVYQGFGAELLRVYPELERMPILGPRRHPWLTAPGPQLWLILHGCWFALAGWHIFHEDRELGRY
jgi:hypothetical protein